jgi:caffeoyl-CoA O-methyltransferase
MRVEDYIEKHITPPSEVLQRLEKITWQKLINPRMCSGSYQGRLLSLITKMISPKLILELGTFTGYSTLCLLEGLHPEGLLHTVDVNDELQWIHEEFLSDPRIVRHYMAAEDFLSQQDWSQVDLLFIDADKGNYLRYWESVEAKLKKGAVILLDNVLWSGKVLLPTERGDTDTETLKLLNQRIANSTDWESLIIPIRDGITLARKK